MTLITLNPVYSFPEFTLCVFVIRNGNSQSVKVLWEGWFLPKDHIYYFTYRLEKREMSHQAMKVRRLFKNQGEWNAWPSSGYNSAFTAVPQVQSLARELRSSKSHSTAKKKQRAVSHLRWSEQHTQFFTTLRESYESLDGEAEKGCLQTTNSHDP